ncbi:hypothetical protein ABLN73_20685, partial [Mycobacterium tuberculosis]
MRAVLTISEFGGGPYFYSVEGSAFGRKAHEVAARKTRKRFTGQMLLTFASTLPGLNTKLINATLI